MSTSEAPARVPAWKRLGLQLKYARDTPQDTENLQPPANQAPKATSAERLSKPQKRPFHDTKPATPAKRSKPAERPPIHSNPSGGKRSAFDDYQRSRAQAPQRHIGSLGPSGTLQAAGVAPKRLVFDDDDSPTQPAQPAARVATPVQQLARPPSPRKSVSFTPDTKGQDGFSAQNFFKALDAGESPAENAATPTTVEEAKSKEKKKKVKKSKSTLISHDNTAPGAKTASKEAANTAQDNKASTQVPPYVGYLQQYYSDRGSWKFSKKHQNNLLKNLFNIYRISPEHNPAIVQYISGLQGSARLRVAEQAIGVLKAIWEKHNDDQGMSVDTPAARRVAYYHALQQHIERFAASGAERSQYIDEQLEEIKREVEEGKRSEQILEHMESELEQLLDKALAEESASGQSVTSSASEPVKAEPPVSREASKVSSSENFEKKRNKRKARTQTHDDEEDSSSESSNGDESE